LFYNAAKTFCVSLNDCASYQDGIEFVLLTFVEENGGLCGKGRTVTR
jgi:hypothetical protein